MPEAHPDDVDALVVDARTGDRAWLQAADVIVAQHRTRRRAQRWAVSIRRRFPGCVVAVSWSRRGRWLMVGTPGPAVHTGNGPYEAGDAAEVGRLVYVLWTRGGGGRS